VTVILLAVLLLSKSAAAIGSDDCDIAGFAIAGCATGGGGVCPVGFAHAYVIVGTLRQNKITKTAVQVALWGKAIAD
jgi:hypothetical protein